MMAHITVLPKEIYELIAAGEVIERPASVIKELVENAVDAHASHITVEIKQGGTTFMRVMDDGDGMAPEEIPTAFLRHATSKITEKEDLDKIFTLGFRGEALASIAAVSKVTVLTKRRTDAIGSVFSISGSTPGNVEQAGCPDGTTILIRDLFYNVPVRQRFLKRDVAEGNAVSRIVQKIALSHPEISFRMIRDNRQEFRTDGNGDLYATIYAVCGKEFALDLIPVSYQEGDYKIDGFIGKPLYARANRTFQNFFINQRYIRSLPCSIALENAYENLVMSGKFPTCVLLIAMPPDQVDVNIHPTKEEVRFSREKEVCNAIFLAAKNALMQDGLLYDFQMEKVKQPVDWTAPPPIPPKQESFFAQNDFPPKKEAEPQPPLPVAFENKLAPEMTKYSETPIVPPIPREAPPRPSPENVPQKPKGKLRVIGEAFHNYIVAECDDPESLVIFDKHAAHERIRFEALRSGQSKQTRQLLLRPVETLLSMEEFTAVQENLDKLEEIGFTFDCSTAPLLKTLAVPALMLDMNLDEIIPEMARKLMLGKNDPSPDSFQRLLETIACKSAVRAGDHSDMKELEQLAREVWENEEIRHCPHGRPIMFVIRRYDLEKQFRRT